MDKKSSNKDFGILDVILTVVSNLPILFKTLSFFLIVSLVYLFFIAETQYTSFSKIISSGSGNNQLSQAEGLALQFGISINPNQGDQQYVYEDILKSRTLLDKILDKTFTTKKFGDDKLLIDILSKDIINEKLLAHELRYLCVDKLTKMIFVDKDINTGIITINVSSFEPLFSQAINFELINTLEDNQHEYNYLRSSETRIFIESRIDETKKDLNNAEEELKTFRARNRNMQNSPSLLLEQERLAREVSVLTGVFTTLKQQLENAKIEEVRDAEYVILVEKPILPIYPSYPNKLNHIFLSCIFSLSLGMFFILIKDFYPHLRKRDKEKIFLILKRIPLLNKFI